jgi:hypothetical protein
MEQPVCSNGVRRLQCRLVDLTGRFEFVRILTGRLTDDLASLEAQRGNATCLAPCRPSPLLLDDLMQSLIPGQLGAIHLAP